MYYKINSEWAYEEGGQAFVSLEERFWFGSWHKHWLHGRRFDISTWGTQRTKQWGPLRPAVVIPECTVEAFTLNFAVSAGGNGHKRICNGRTVCLTAKKFLFNFICTTHFQIRFCGSLCQNHKTIKKKKKGKKRNGKRKSQWTLLQTDNEPIYSWAVMALFSLYTVYK